MDEVMVVKVKTGETVIGFVKEETPNGIRLSHPMEVRTQVLFDKMGTIKKEMTVLVSLLPGCQKPEIRYPKSMILAKVDPRPDMLKHYQIEVDVEKKSSDPEFMKQFMDHMMKSEQLKQEPPQEEPDDDEDVDVKDIITDMLESVIEMIGNEEMTKEMIEESIDDMEEDANRDPNHPDFGTRYTDWSRNPEDYL